MLITPLATPACYELLPATMIKPRSGSMPPTDNIDTSIITRTAPALTNLTRTVDDDDDDDDDDEQLKRSSLGLARDSLELLRNATSHTDNSDEQLIPNTNINSTSCKRRSVLKARLNNSDNLSALELISYIAVDEIEGDDSSMEKQMRYDL